MAGVYPKVAIRGTQQLLETARSQKRNIRRTVQRAIQASGIYVQEITEELFQASEDYGLFFPGDRGMAWVDRVNEKDYGHPKLVKSGQLRRSIRRESRVIRRSNNRWYMYGRVYQDLAKAHYGNRHQYGDEVTNTPPRPFLFVNIEEERHIQNIFDVNIQSIFQH